MFGLSWIELLIVIPIVLAMSFGLPIAILVLLIKLNARKDRD